MRRLKPTQSKLRLLELRFASLWLRLDGDERRRVLDCLSGPCRRRWFVVDGRGLRELED